MSIINVLIGVIRMLVQTSKPSSNLNTGLTVCTKNKSNPCTCKICYVSYAAYTLYAMYECLVIWFYLSGDSTNKVL